eukprot:COSAG02_NODE_205_length_29157_cov_13.424771_4_plen_186_part_00
MIDRYISSHACQLIKGLLEKVPAKRPDASTIKSIGFFNGIDWAKLFDMEVKPPVMPEVAGPMDISNIPDKYTKDEAPVDSPVSPSSLLSPTKADIFSGFTFDGDDGAELLQRSDNFSGGSPEISSAQQLAKSLEERMSQRSSTSISDGRIERLSPLEKSHTGFDSDVSDGCCARLLILCVACSVG